MTKKRGGGAKPHEETPHGKQFLTPLSGLGKKCGQRISECLGDYLAALFWQFYSVTSMEELPNQNLSVNSPALICQGHLALPWLKSAQTWAKNRLKLVKIG